MKNTKLYAFSFILIILALTAACSGRTEQQETNMKQWETKTYITDLEHNICSEVLTSYDTPFKVSWAEDSRYFAVVENVINEEGESIRSIARVYSYGTENKLTMLKEINDKDYPEVSVDWADKENMIITHLGKDSRRYTQYNIKKNTIEGITALQAGSVFEKVSGREALLAYRYQAPRKDEIRRELVKKTGTEYEEGILSLDGSKFIFGTKEMSVGLLDVNTGKTTHLFDGVGLALSPGETKVAYAIPKSEKISGFSRYDTCTSNDMETWVYDLEKGTSVKVADFYATVYFSPDGRYIIFYPEKYVGQPSI